MQKTAEAKQLRVGYADLLIFLPTISLILIIVIQNKGRNILSIQNYSSLMELEYPSRLFSSKVDPFPPALVCVNLLRKIVGNRWTLNPAIP